MNINEGSNVHNNDFIDQTSPSSKKNKSLSLSKIPGKDQEAKGFSPKMIPRMLRNIVRPRRNEIRKIVDIQIVPNEQSLRDHPVINSFKRDIGPKILLIAEGHNSDQAIFAREFILSKAEKIRGFSEGVTGQPQLCGLKGVESSRDCEASTILKDYIKYQGVQGYSKNDTNKYLMQYAEYSDEDILNLDDLFYNKSIKEKEKFVVDMQIHKRDIKFSNEILEECRVMLKTGEMISVGFFGASHIVSGYDGDDKRQSKARIPDILLYFGGVLGEHSIIFEGVNIYVLPKVYESDEPDIEFPSFFENTLFL